MRTITRLTAPLAALALLASACDADDAGADGGDDGNGAETTTDDADDGEDGDDEGADDDEAEGDEHAEAVWDGEELVFAGVSCGTLPADDDYEIRGRLDEGGGNLQARFASDPAQSDGDDVVLADETPHTLTLFFDEGDTIGDGREFRADTADLEQLDGSVGHVAGTVHLDPQDNTRAPETHPEGGEIEFELRCG